MADTISTSKNLSIGIDMGYKTSITIPNYKTSITEQQIKNAFANQDVIIYGYDENENPQPVTSDQIYTASTTNQTINNIDIGWE